MKRRGCIFRNFSTLKARPGFLLFLALPFFAGCGTVHVRTAADPTFSFQNYHSYNFREPATNTAPVFFTPREQAFIKEAVSEELERRGLVLSDHPDLFVSGLVAVKPKTFDLEHPTAQGGSLADIMTSYYGFVLRSGQSFDQQGAIPYHEGTLVLNLIDARKNELVWQEVAQGVIYKSQSEDATKRRIREAVHSAFERSTDGVLARHRPPAYPPKGLGGTGD